MSQQSTDFNVVVFISGNGSNLQALIDAGARGELTANIVLVISDRTDAHGLVRAKQANIPTAVFSRNAFPSKNAFEAAILAKLAEQHVDLIVLAGYMRVLSADFIRTYPNRIINIHPALLPKYKGLDTYRRVLGSGDQEHGTSVHLVTEKIDDGLVVAQSRCPIEPNDDENTLKIKVQALEHQLYPKVVQFFADGTLSFEQSELHYHNALLTKAIQM